MDQFGVEVALLARRCLLDLALKRGDRVWIGGFFVRGISASRNCNRRGEDENRQRRLIPHEEPPLLRNASGSSGNHSTPGRDYRSFSAAFAREIVPPRSPIAPAHPTGQQFIRSSSHIVARNHCLRSSN